MDFGFCGVIDIVIVVGVLLFAFIGYKKGFGRKILSPLTIIIFIAASLLLCGSLARLLINNNLSDFIRKPINNLFTNVEISECTSYSDVLKGTNTFSFIANTFDKPITSAMGEFSEAVDPIANVVDYLTRIALNCICFFALFIVMIIVAAILRGIANKRETVGVIRFVDGLLGIVLYIAIYGTIICLIFWGVSLVIDYQWFSPVKSFLVDDMKLDTDAFRISKIIYEGNIIKTIFAYFF